MPVILVLDKVIREIVEALEKDEDALEAYLFGSMARGDYHLDSDIDFLVISENLGERRKSF
ncbi:nucleotidyltransferase domain-containing protein [Candidatus Bathyarchaeota archaeon]|nr:nucleotidyltransferase domain-containing protein [Candidatus Bathyarchaeota archaeon]